tara:strand:+ start:410 stop:1081 length:672 start_codon:yes stop_codon:yes gene_type:complete
MVQELLPPQLVTKARMLYFCWVPADPTACAALLPAGLTQAENKAIYINQYVVDTDEQTSHFGAYSLTYMGIDLAGMNVDGETPGRYWTHYYNSNPRMRAYAAERGIPAEAGKTELSIESNILMATTEASDGTLLFKTRAQVSDQIAESVRGHLRYITKGENGLESGRYAYVGDIVANFEILSFEFFAPDHPSYVLRPADPLEITFGFYSPASSFCYPGGVEAL